MINLHAISIQNIGPFKNQPIVFFFEQGKYLIESPIGSGKSFLFFDAPIYGLFKYATRQVLNTQSKKGSISIIFEINKELYLVTRSITKAKTKESCTSKFYKLAYSSLDEIKNSNKKIDENREKNGEEIVFKNETDLQQTIETLLPPREVFLNTAFLMQDANNIFDLAPAERLNILKTIFNLMSIDEAKENIANKKREVSFSIKTLGDTGSKDKQLQEDISSYLSLYKEIIETGKQLGEERETSEAFKRKENLEMIKEKIQISEFSDEDFPREIYPIVEDFCIKKEQEYQVLLHKQQSLQVQEQELRKQLEETLLEINNKTQENNRIEQQLQKTNPEALEKNKEKKNMLREQQNNIETNLSKEALEAFFKKEIKDTSDARKNIQEIIHTGKQLHQERENIQLQQEKAEIQEKNTKERLENEIKNKENTKNRHLLQIDKIRQSIDKIHTTIQEKNTFVCEKIGDNCPFIKHINTNFFTQQEETLLEAEKEIKEINQEITIIDEDIKKIQQQILLPQNEEEKQKKENLNKEEKEKEKKIEEIKSFLTTIERKTIQENNEKIQIQEKEIKEIDQEIQIQEKALLEIQNLQKTRENNNGQLETLNKNKTTKEEEIKQLKEVMTDIYKTIEATDTKRYRQLQNTLQKQKEKDRDIHKNIQDHKANQQTIKKLQQEEKILNNLYQIFSKELLLLALQDSIPILNDIMNSYLSQVVDYQVAIQILQTTPEKIELEAKVIDEKGEREIKSLSGGQRVLLKLTRMLAISAYTQSPMLFLDETINNLDQETIGKVADMLQDFVKQRNIKFYTITHSQQIQDMDIRDKKLEIRKIINNE